MRAAVLFSGGKDSVAAAHFAVFGGYETTLLTVRALPYSDMFHFPNLRWARVQAEAMGLAHRFVRKEDLPDVLKGFDVLFTGAVESSYQRFYLDRLGRALGIRTVHRLWMADEKVAQEIYKDFVIVFGLVAADGMGEDLLGKEVRLAPRVHPFFEGGEAETFVLDAPLFKKRLRIERFHVRWEKIRGYMVIDALQSLSKS